MGNPELAEPYVDLRAGGRSIIAPLDMPENCLTELQEGLPPVLMGEEFQEVIGENVDVPRRYTRQPRNCRNHRQRPRRP